MGRQDFETETLIPTGGFFDGVITQYGDKAAALTARHDSSLCADRGQNVVAFAENSRGEVRLEDGDGQRTGVISQGGGKPGQGYPAVAGRTGVRRLTPVECERLQGFPDGHTLVEYRGKPAADGPRYKAIGNSMAVPVMQWVGNKIKKFDGLIRQ
jgi:DNA (cytosine-5)-methyltransferase 1